MLTSRERIQRMYAHQEADRIPIVDDPWGSTLARWRREGLPEDTAFEDFFGIDRIRRFTLDNSPQFPEKVLEETADHITRTTAWGVTVREWKRATSTPEFLDFTIVDRASWAGARARILSGTGRIEWDRLAADFARWRAEGAWIQPVVWFGFDVTHSWMVGTERVLIALIEDPDWLRDIFETTLEVNLELLDRVWAAGYTFDAVGWYDDMGYKHHPFFSLRTYREVLKPFHQRVIDWAHGKGIPAHLHSCGDVNTFVPEWVGMGLDALNPLEVKAGMDPLHLKEEYGRDLVLHGGVNAVLWDQPEAIAAEIRHLVPELKRGGGYIFSSDHSVPDAVSLADFRRITDLVKAVGSYG